MSSGIVKTSSNQTFAAGLFLFLVAATAVIGLLLWELRQSRQNDLDAANVTLQYQARALGHQIGSSLRGLERSLDAVASMPGTPAVLQSDFPPEGFFDEIRRHSFAETGLADFRLINRTGIEIATVNGPSEKHS